MRLFDATKEIAAEPKTFSNLPRPAQKALIQYYGLESNDYYAETLENSRLIFLVYCQDNGETVDVHELESAWDDAIALVANFDVGKHWYAEMEANTFCNELFAMNEEIHKEYATFMDYHQWYTSAETPSHSNNYRYPVVLGCPVEGIVDGWHRLHSYVKSGHQTIPLLLRS